MKTAEEFYKDFFGVDLIKYGTTLNVSVLRFAEAFASQSQAVTPSEPIPEAKSAEEIDLIQYVTNLLYYAHVEAMDMHSIDFDKWVDENTTNLKEYASQFSQPKELPNKPGYPQEFVFWLSFELAVGRISLDLPVNYRYKEVVYSLPELFSFWQNEINK